VASYYLLVDPHRVLVPEGRLANQHLVDKDAQGPPIHRGTVSTVANDFWSKIFRSATEGVRHSSAMRIFTFRQRLTFRRVRWWWKVLGESKIDKFEVPVSIQENILGFEVSVGDMLHIVEVRKDQGDFGSVELDRRDGEPTGTPEVGEYFSARGVIEL
jgi:hypothetical protein